MVFIDKTKEIIKLFEESTREEIGTSLLAYEEFISKGLKVSDKDLQRLTEVFNYYDEKLSGDYPSLTNEALQYTDNLITNYFDDEKKVKKDGYRFNLEFSDVNNESTDINVAVLDDRTGVLYNEMRFNVKHSSTHSDYGKDSFNTIYNACEKITEKLNKTEIDKFLGTYKL